MPLNRITLVVQPIPNLLNFAFLAALIAFAECLLPFVDSSDFPVLCRNISLYNPHYVPHSVCSSTRSHQLLKCNPICLSQILPKIQPLKTKNQRAMKSKGYLSCRRYEAFSICCTPPQRWKDIPRGYGKSSYIQRSLEHNQRWKETAKILLQFLLPATKNPHLLQESSLPECLAQSSYWQTLLYLTYMCFLMSETKSLSIKTWKYEREILKSLLLCKENFMPDTLLSIKSVCQSMLLSVQANHKGAEDCLHFSLSFLQVNWPANPHLPKTEFLSPWLQIINSHKRGEKILCSLDQHPPLKQNIEWNLKYIYFLVLWWLTSVLTEFITTGH